MDKLDLLGVRYDVELELKAKHELAEKIYNYWDNLCKNNLSKYSDLKNNCIITICIELGLKKYELTEEVQEIWRIIEDEYLNKQKNQYHKDNLQNRLIHNNIYYNLLKHSELNENEKRIFLENTIDVEDELMNIEVTKELCENDIDIKVDYIEICIKNQLSDKEILNNMNKVFKSHRYSYVLYRNHKKRVLKIYMNGGNDE